MSQSPLNYSSVDYDFVGLQVHASGEIWSATNFDIRSAMIAPVRCRHAGTAEVLRQRRDAGDVVPGQPALGAADVRLVPADGRPARSAWSTSRDAMLGRGHDPLRWREPGHPVERVRQARPR